MSDISERAKGLIDTLVAAMHDLARAEHSTPRNRTARVDAAANRVAVVIQHLSNYVSELESARAWQGEEGG